MVIQLQQFIPGHGPVGGLPDFVEDPINRHPGNADLPRNFGGTVPSADELPNASSINPRLGAGVDALLLGTGYALGLTLAPDVGLELGEHGQHAEEGAASRCRRIDALLDNPEVAAKDALCHNGMCL